MGVLQMIYGVFYANYSDWYPVGYFENEEDAYKYCEGYMGAGHIVLPIKNLLGEKDLSVISLKYEFKIIFREDGTMANFGRGDDGDDEYCKRYVSEELRCNHIGTYGRWTNIKINLNRKDWDLASKIAQDYYVELKSYGDGKILDKNIDLMNKKFEAPFLERKRIRKEEELKQKELAELKRLKDKYENSLS